MPVLTPAERRGATVLVALLLIGTGWDAWRSARPVFREVEAVRPPVAAEPVGPARAAPGRPTPPRDTTAARVDLNAAGEIELDALPGIGPVLARRILEHRRRHGPFRTPDELLAVPGIGPRLAERLRPHVRCGPPPP